MGDQNIRCLGIPPFPDWAESSETYRTLVNEELAARGTGMVWSGDKPGGQPNFPDVSSEPPSGEIVEFSKHWEKYPNLAENPEALLKLFRDDVCAAMVGVESRRREVARDGFARWTIVSNPAKRHLDRLNPAERAWEEVVKEPLTFHVDAIYGKASTYQYERYREWMEAHGDFFSKRQFARLMTPDVDISIEGKTPEEIRKIRKYANAFPWFETKPLFNAMFSPDITKEDLEYINANFGEHDLIRMPYSVVEKASAQEAKTFRPQKNDRGQVVAEVVKGKKGDRWYKATNMAFDPRYRPHFLAIAETLRRYAGISVREGRTLYTLPSGFKNYTLTIADTAEQGDFVAWLNADLQQPAGNLFLSIFPHEGYWPDGVKYPFMMQLGIREKGNPKDAELWTKMANYLEERSARVLGPINGYKPRKISAAEALQSGAVLVWHLRAAGFLGAVPNTEVGGNDYPKRSYPGIGRGQHRKIGWLDPMVASVPSYRRFAELFLTPEFVNRIPSDGSGSVDSTLGHEVTHGVAMRPQDATDSGRSFSDAYGKYWEVLVEPLADWGSMAGLMWLYRQGLISRERMEGRFYNGAFTLLRNGLLKEAVSTDEAFLESAQPVGLVAELGALTAGGAIRMLPNHDFAVDLDRWEEIARERFDTFTAFTGRDDLTGYKKFLRDEISKTPDDLLNYLLDLKRRFGRPYILVNRDRFEE